MRILHVLPDAEMGGGHVNALRLTAALAELAPGAAEARFLLPADASPTLRRAFAEAGASCAFGRHRGRRGLARLALDIAREGRGADIVHAHGLRAALAARMARAAGGGRFGLLYNVRGTHVASWRNQRLARALQGAALRGADAVALVSQADARLNAERYGLDAHPLAAVIPNGVAAPPGPPPADEARDLDVLFVGRLTAQKDPEAFARTLAHLTRLRGRAPRALVIGGGELEGALRARLAALGLDEVRLSPALPNAQVQQAMRRARLLVMTSRWEGLPTVAIEAALNGAAPVGFDVFAETIPPALRAPLVAPARDPAALAALAAALLDAPERRAALAGALREHALAAFSPEAMARGYLALYARINPARSASTVP
ncbi:glycosyltransferase family 4 protein [Oceanicella actignis]|uniref:Glycosyltransferase involved in cell wall bisynthesis n=1 Tax=Oceanicella actignis TaxID=1189325 RepID=A0A1M7SWT6_9RHOB|nr:glycosyltransferase family 4 protein [Oceanicella actignis]SES74231.1 Glycosyltransferase Family 4 [Oceanicella actignis]SHN62929.1 Glycosyltransferase involved in cell wall bisynthesis [Oceanicella actignis]